MTGMAAKYCADCGEPLVVGKGFCPGCGAAAAEGPIAGTTASGSPADAGTPSSPPAAPTPLAVLPRLIVVVVGLALAAAGVSYVYDHDPETARYLDMVKDKIDSIITPKPPIGDLTPVRDLKGTWRSSLRGKGYQVYGSFGDGASNVKVYQEGDVELVIDSVKGNAARGSMRLMNVYGSARGSVPGRGSVSTPRMLIVRDSGRSPITIRVSGTRLDFGSFDAGGLSGTMQGSYTTDLIRATMTVQTEYGPVKGEFHLMRQK